MGANANLVILMGNLTRDPELKYLGSGAAVVDFGIAVNERFKQGDNWTERTNFIDCTAFGKTAENLSEYCSKGSPVHVIGSLRTESWEKDGQKRSKLKVIADRVQFLSSKGERRTQTERQEEPSDDLWQ
jgi:single-strand DNA-binding protein